MMELQDLQPDSICTICDGLEKTIMPDGFVIYKPETEKVHYLNPTAAVVFELCDGTKNLAEISEFLQVAYNLSERPLQETLNCAQTLIDQGLLRLCPR